MIELELSPSDSNENRKIYVEKPQKEKQRKSNYYKENEFFETR